MELKNLITNDREIEIEHPGFDGLFVKLAYVSRETTKKFIEKATTSAFDRKTREMSEHVDNDLFLDMYVPATVKGWKGFKYKYLEELLPVDLSSVDPEDELDYTTANALQLMKNSIEFDSWVSSVVRDIKNFNKNS
jgi:hypothetical protein